MPEKQNAAPSVRTGGAPNSNFAGSKSGSDHRPTIRAPQGRKLCGSCRFFNPWSHSGTGFITSDGNRLDYGECRFNPPQAFEFEHRVGFPEISPDDWCGKHEVAE